MLLSPLSILACLLSAVGAQSGTTSNPPTTPPGFKVTAGTSSMFTWTPTTSGTVTLTLRNGPASNLNKGIVLASGIVNSGSYVFTVPAGTASGAYTIEISSDSNASDANYSDNITVEGSDSVGSASPSPSSLTTTSSSSTSSSSTITTDTSITTTNLRTSTISHAYSGNLASSSSTLGATKSLPSASGTSAPTSSASTVTGSSKGTSPGSVLGVNNGLLAVVLGILAMF